MILCFAGCSEARRRRGVGPAGVLLALALLTAWRLVGWTAIGLLPSALPEVLVGRDGIAGLAGLVWVGLALGVWAALRGAPTPFPLLADASAEVATRYGALSDWLVMKMAKRYTFLIDPAGKVAKVYLSVDTSRHSAEIVADLKRLQTAR